MTDESAPGGDSGGRRPRRVKRSIAGLRTDRGVSDTLGFVFVFALILSTVGLTYAVGLEGLQGTRDVERVNNAERAFDVLADNVDDVARHGASSRATEVKLADASLSMDDPVVLNVTVVEDGDASNNDSVEYDVTPIVFDADTGTSLVYSTGAVVREQDDSAVMVNAPPWVIGSDRVAVPVVETRPDRSSSSVGGTTTALVRTEHSTSNLDVVGRDSLYNVTINVSTTRADAWRRYLRDGGMICPSDPDLNNESFVSCELERVDRVFVVDHKVDVLLV